MAKISICVPTWESNGHSDFFTRELFDSIKKQSFNDFEVCISDQSKDDVVLEICEEYANFFEIRYFRNTEDLGNGPANTNSAIEMASGEIVKIMFQDDFLFSEQCLELIDREFSNSDRMWLVSGCNHFQQNIYYNEMTPKWSDDIINGVNTISSPSVLSIKSVVTEKFDPNLKMMMDCDYYYNLYSKYGEPLYLNQTLITNRVHQNQISSLYVNDDNYEKNLKEEIDYCLIKYNLNK